MASAAGQPPEVEFLRSLSEAVTRFLRSIDDWEAAYRRFYRMPGSTRTLTPELSAIHTEYVGAYEALSKMVPRARRMCRAYDVRDVWPALIRVEPKLDAPQFRFENAIGRNERIAVVKCIEELTTRCGEIDQKPAAKKPLLRKLIDYFY